MPVCWQDLTHDILKQAYTFCGDRDLTRCAQTCKNWTDPALDIIWFELEAKEFVNLFAILAPLEPAQLHCQSSDFLTRMEFTRPISHRDWKRFIPYASRVRIMDGFDHQGQFSMISEAALADILITRPSTNPILPRIKTLKVDGELVPDYPWCKFFTGLLHDGLQELCIYIPSLELSPDAVLSFLEEVVWRSPNITSLSIESSLMTFVGDVGVSLSSSISRMHNLRKFVALSCLLTPVELCVLEQLPHLQEVSIFFDSHLQGRMTNGALPKFVSPNPFPQLTSLELQASLAELCRYLSLANGISPGLRTLFVDVISQSKFGIFQNALVKIAEAFPHLEYLSITRNEDFNVVDEVAGSVRPPLTYGNLHPLTRMTRLQTFILKYEVVVSMTNRELCTLLSQCPSLVALDLNQEPIVLSPTELTINVLPLIAQACPRLADLALYVDTNVKPLETSSLSTFTNLKSISLGISLLQCRPVVATLLAQVLPEGCRLISKPSFEQKMEEQFGEPNDVETRAVRRKEWAQVSEWIPILLEVRRGSFARANEGTE